MSAELKKDKSALDHIDDFGGSFDWEWPVVWILVGLTALWLWRTYSKNEQEKRNSEELCKQSLKEDRTKQPQD